MATGRLYWGVHILFFTPITDDIRVICFRKANSREVKRYKY
ncbi:MAG: hypothetical protein HRU20_03030 [Pseudomonadales bacterium]|nr:hypothetical protein [Pseudomonadales bacterium]